MTPSRRRLQGYLLGRCVVLVLLLVLAVTFKTRQGGDAAPFQWFFGATAASFAFTAASAFFLRRERPAGLLTRLQPAWDVAYASALVFLTGGAVSPFASLYSLAIIGGAILLFRKGALVTATASSIAFGVLVDLEYYGLVTPLNPYPLRFAEGDSIVPQLVFNLVAFYAIAVLSGFLAEELRLTGERLSQVQAEVLDLEHLKDSILDSLGSGVVALDRAGREVFHNRAAESLLARAHTRLGAGADVGRLFDLAAKQRSEAVFNQGRVAFGYTVSPLVDRNDSPRGSLLIFQDLSDIKRLEQDLRRSDRLAAVGRLAAGLAHEVRNPLASLSGSVEVLRASVAAGPEEDQLFAIVLRETERLDRLVTNFLHYARPESPERRDVDLAALVDETVFFFLQGEGRQGFSAENRVPPGTRMRGDRAQLEQLLLNLFRNSREAAPGGVRITVEGRSDAEGVWLAVRDDGPGMVPEVVERAFEPFFSNRDGGVGLGLATVHRVAENHGGTVSVATEPGKGAEFRFLFPA